MTTYKLFATVILSVLQSVTNRCPKSIVVKNVIKLKNSRGIMSCCTENAWGELKNPNYKEKGIVEKVDDLEIYRVGSSSKCIIWCYDVFGFKVRISTFLERLFAMKILIVFINVG